MAHTSLIRKSEDCFNLAQKIVKSLSETYNFNPDDGWGVISSQTTVQLQKKFKKLKRANNPLSSIKKPRTSFSFFTKENRNNIQRKNPNATFGELSKLVSVAWKKLSEKDKKHYKALEVKDKKRYASEKEELLKSISNQENSIESKETIEPSSEKETTEKKSKEKKSDKKTTKGKGSYNVFQKQKRGALKEKKMSLKDQNSELGKMWKSLSVEEKAVFV